MSEKSYVGIPEDFNDLTIYYSDDACVSFVNRPQENPADEEFSPRILQARVLIKKNETDSSTDMIKIELSDHHDIEFLFEGQISKNEYLDFQEKNNLTGEFDVFLEELKNFLIKSIKSSDVFRIAAYTEEETCIRLTFYEMLSLRFIDLFSFQLKKPSDEYIKKYIQWHFDCLKEIYLKKSLLLDKRYNKLNKINPKLYKAVKVEIEALL